MSATEEPFLYTKLIEEAIAGYWGERCPEHFIGCPCCDAWDQLDELISLAAKGPA